MPLYIKLDDDIISPYLLENLKNYTEDVFYDDYHTFVDITSGIITSQKRNWIASTCVHKKEHAFSIYSGEGAGFNLLYSDHSKVWHKYYSTKHRTIASRQHPVIFVYSLPHLSQLVG